MKIRLFVILLAGAVLIASIAMAVENKGAEQISIDAGSRGNISFPHHAHQNRLKDCNTCHAMFPQEPGAISQLKDIGQLQKKEVMNKLCINCHKAENKAGNKNAPTSCSKCHRK